jgi:hypothetical protein
MQKQQGDYKGLITEIEREIHGMRKLQVTTVLALMPWLVCMRFQFTICIEAINLYGLEK